jgi:allantoate deiminase
MADVDFLTHAQQVIGWCGRLAEHTEEPGWITRTFLSEPMHAVHADVRTWMQAVGLDAKVDAAGNIRGVSRAAQPGSKRLMIGSHLDTVPHAGAYDGILGVMLGIKLAELVPEAPLEVIGFSEEEGVRFGVPFIGSCALIGQVDEALLQREDRAGISVAAAIRNFGLDPTSMAGARMDAATSAYLEFHIEQGPVLESLDLRIGVVDSIVGQSRLLVKFIGHANHAGTTPMHLRKDALACAAEWIGTVEREALGTEHLVATVGNVQAEPGAGNVIAGVATCTLDVRHPDDPVRQAAVKRLLDKAAEIAGQRGLTATSEIRLEQAAAKMDPAMMNGLQQAAVQCGDPAHTLHSGAGHDAMVLARQVPSAMLFLRSPGGISHHPDEAVRAEDVAAALAVGFEFIQQWEAKRV